jgi:hypothetical protein
MAITGRLISGHIGISVDGATSLTAGIDLIDDAMGQVGHKAVVQDDPAVIAAVNAFIETQLPALSALAGCEVTLPEPAAAPVDDVDDEA